MEYDAEQIAQAPCLYNTLEGYLVRCKHGLHDDSLIEHYETIYQNNYLYYNKILALLKRTLETSKMNSDRISAVIDNDLELKDGMQLEIERLREKLEDADQQIKELEEQTDEVTGIFEGYGNKELGLEQSLERIISLTKSTEEQIVLSYYALTNIKASVTHIQRQTNDVLLNISKKKRDIEVKQNVYRLLGADIEGLAHQHKTRVKLLGQQSIELDNEKTFMDKEYTALIHRRSQIKDHITSLIDNNQRMEMALSSMETDILQRSINITRLREELQCLENKVATLVGRLTAATETKQRMNNEEAANSIAVGGGIYQISQLSREIEAIIRSVDKVPTMGNSSYSANHNTKHTIEERETHMKQLEETYRERINEINRAKAIRSKHIAACNTMRMQIDEMITLLGVKSLSRLKVARELIYQRTTEKTAGDIGFQDLQQLNTILKHEKIKMTRSEKDISQQIESTTLELRNIISHHDALTRDLEATEKRTWRLNEEIERLQEELTQLTSKEDQRSQMKIDLINERDYIKKSIEELMIADKERKVLYTKQVQEQIEAHKLKLKQLKCDDSSDFAEIIDEETKNSNILLNAALESLELENTKDKSKLESKYNGMIAEEDDKFKAIRQVNTSEITRLRRLVDERRSRMKEAVVVPVAIVTKPPEDITKIPQPKDINVRFKTPTPPTATSNTTPSSSHDRIISAEPVVKKEVRRKCIRRTSTKTDAPKSGPEDELDLFC